MHPAISVGEATTYHTAPHVPLILIVEDDHMLSKMYSEKFTIEGFNVIVARDGNEAYTILKNKTPDCILLDLLIPEIDGLSLLQKLKDENGTIPNVVALTNIAEDKQRKLAFDLGVKDYLVKAMYTPEKVVIKIKQVMEPTPIHSSVPQ